VKSKTWPLILIIIGIILNLPHRELIVGYKNLEVNLTYGAGSLRTLVDVKYSDKVDSKLFEVKNTYIAHKLFFTD
jgi:Histone acetyl transferase HAT1 N-terminus